MIETTDLLYPASPRAIPDTLLAPTAAYKRHVWLAVMAIALFLALYGSLLGYFGWFIYRVFVMGEKRLIGFFVSLPAMFFFAFLVQGLFAFRRAKLDELVEIFERDEPRLFAFIRQVSKETGAPFPHRVFVSARVNAGVFYDISFKNLLWPTNKNLEIGLGVVNVLSIDEFKAVIAHEFGHFAQRSMAVGRWVYIGHQVASQIIGARGRFDRFLQGLSVQDLRIAWIGWVLRVFVWAIRAILDTSFVLVVLAHRALGREMEFAADRVAVSVSGSDSIIHALHRLGPADEAWQTALGNVLGHLHEKKTLADIFAIQSVVLEHLRTITADPGLGCTPIRTIGDAPGDSAASHRVFASSLAQPPRMWSTHPANRDREENAKAVYLPSELHAESVWRLFEEPARRRNDAVRAFVAAVRERNRKMSVELGALEVVDSATQACVQKVAENYGRPALASRYQGAYMGRATALYFPTCEAMLGENATRADEIASLYPASLRDLMKRFREERANEAELKGMQEGFLTAPGGVVRYQGREYKKSELHDVLALATAAREATQKQIVEHDRKCRAVHQRMAHELGHGWDAYHRSIVMLLHCVSHAAHRVADAHAFVHNELNIALADGSVSRKERERLLSVASDLHAVLEDVWQLAKSLELPSEVRALFEADKGFVHLTQNLGLGQPLETNLGDWLSAMDGWAHGAAEDLQVLSNVLLDVLLEVENRIASAYQAKATLGDAPTPGKTPNRYAVLGYGNERERQKRLGLWDRFQVADGFFAGLSRFVVACLILVPALVFGMDVGSATVHVYNGLPVSVVAIVGGQSVLVAPNTTETVAIRAEGQVTLQSSVSGGQAIEQFVAEIGNFGDYVYNVGNAGLMVEWTATYGSAIAGPERRLGAPRFFVAEQHTILRTPPRTMSSRSGHSSIKVLSAASLQPNLATEHSIAPADRHAAIASILRTANPSSDVFSEWATFDGWDAAALAVLTPIVQSRGTIEFATWFKVQELAVARGAQRQQLCRNYTREAYDRQPSGESAILVAECLSAGERADFLLAARERFPEHVGLGRFAADALTKDGRLHDAHAALVRALDAPEWAMARNTTVDRLVRNHRLFGAEFGALPFDEASVSVSNGGVYYEQLARNANADSTNAERALSALLRGDCPSALAFRELAQLHDLMVGLCSASDGQTSDVAHGAQELAFANHEIPPPTIWAAAAVLRRDGSQVPSNWLGAESPLGEEDAQLLASLVAAETPAALRAKIAQVTAQETLYLRAQAMAYGAVVLGADAPALWRQTAMSYLFFVERPWFALQ